MDKTSSAKNTTLLKHQDLYDLRKRIESLDSPCFDAEIMSKGLEIAAFYVSNGYTKFIDFSHKMLQDVGNCIRPFLKCLYSGVRYCPGLELSMPGMSSVDFVEKIDVGGIRQDNKYYQNTWKTAFGIWSACERIEEGYSSIESLAGQMVRDFGDAIRPEIAGCYEQARNWFSQKGRDDILKGMDSAKAVKAFNPDTFDRPKD